MNIESMGQKVSEALALQGKVNSMEEDCGKLKSSIDSNNKDISRLESMIKGRDESVKKLAELKKELAGVKSELESRLAALDKEGISLPIGSKAVRSGRL